MHSQKNMHETKKHTKKRTYEIDGSPPEGGVAGQLVCGRGEDEVHQRLGGQAGHTRVQGAHCSVLGSLLVSQSNLVIVV